MQWQRIEFAGRAGVFEGMGKCYETLRLGVKPGAWGMRMGMWPYQADL